MESNELTAEQIRERMREIRRDLRADVKGIVVHASHMFDWKSYVRSFPWGSLAAAAIVVCGVERNAYLFALFACW